MKLVPCPISEAELRTLYLETKLTDSEIATQVGCPLKHIRRWRHRWGIETICRTERHEVLPISGRLRSVLVGSMLGDGRISKSTHVARYMENHAEDQRDYLEWKSKEWGSWVQLGLRPVTWTLQDEEYDGWRFETVSHATMLSWHELFYPEPGPKQLQPQMVDLVDTLALAIWFMDDGSAAWWPVITFGMKSESREVAQSIFRKFSLNPRWAPGQGNTGQFIFEGEDQAHLFISLVKPHMPECMLHKLNFGFQGEQYQIRQVLTEGVLRELASKGVPIKRMAKMLGESTTTVDRHLKKHGIDHLRKVGRPSI
jgi:hypothetical protein